MPVTLSADHHSTWVGRTSSGKTYAYGEAVWQPSTLRCIFLNTQRQPGYGPPVTRWDSRLLEKPRSKVNLVGLRPTTDPEAQGAMMDTLCEVVDDLFAIGDSLGPVRVPRVRLGVDEVHLFAPKSAPVTNPCNLVATNGHAYGITGDFIAQRPALTSHTVLSQSMCHVVFDLDTYENGYLDSYGVPEDVREWIRSAPPGKPPGTPNRRFGVRVGKTWTLCRALGEE